MAVRIVACHTTHAALFEALGTLQRLHHKRRLPKASIFVKALSRELPVRLAQTGGRKVSRRNIVQFPVGPGSSNGGLHMTLRANRDRRLTFDFLKVDGWAQGILRVVAFLVRFHDVLAGRAVAHFAIDFGLLEFYMIDGETFALCVSQLAGMAYRAVSLITGCGIQLFPVVRIRALASRSVNHSPKVNPLRVSQIV